MKMEMYYITSTIKDWIPLLARPEFRDIVIKSFKFLIDESRIKLHGYVIMPNHIHAIYTIVNPYILSAIFRDFHKYTSQQMIKLLRNEESNELLLFESTRKDRIYQIWQTTHSPKQIESFPFFRQKLEYIHYNPCSERWKLCELPEQYPFSSARDYLLNEPGVLEIEKVWQ